MNKKRRARPLLLAFNFVFFISSFVMAERGPYRQETLREKEGGGRPKQNLGLDEDAYWKRDLSGQTRFNATTRSVFVPGWGQGFNGQKVKGVVLFTTFAATLTGSILLHEESKNTFEEYESGGRVNGSLFDDYENERTQSLILGSVAGFLWAFGVVDAYRNAYLPILSRHENVEWALLPNQALIRVKKRF